MMSALVEPGKGHAEGHQQQEPDPASPPPRCEPPHEQRGPAVDSDGGGEVARGEAGTRRDVRVEDHHGRPGPGDELGRDPVEASDAGEHQDEERYRAHRPKSHRQGECDDRGDDDAHDGLTEEGGIVGGGVQVRDTLADEPAHDPVVPRVDGRLKRAGDEPAEAEHHGEDDRPCGHHMGCDAQPGTRRTIAPHA